MDIKAHSSNIWIKRKLKSHVPIKGNGIESKKEEKRKQGGWPQCANEESKKKV